MADAEIFTRGRSIVQTKPFACREPNLLTGERTNEGESNISWSPGSPDVDRVSAGAAQRSRDFRYSVRFHAERPLGRRLVLDDCSGHYWRTDRGGVWIY